MEDTMNRISHHKLCFLPLNNGSMEIIPTDVFIVLRVIETHSKPLSSKIELIFEPADLSSTGA